MKKTSYIILIFFDLADALVGQAAGDEDDFF